MNFRASLGLTAIVVSALLLLQACSRPMQPQNSCTFVQNSDLQRVAWRRGLPIPLYIHESVPREAYPTIDNVLSYFNRRFGQGQDLFKVVARSISKPAAVAKDGYSVIYWLDKWDAKKATEQARTTIYWAGNEIFEADLRINADNFRYSYGAEVAEGEIDLESLLIHEIGHVLGLAHNATHGSVMNISLNEGQKRRALSGQDETNLKCEY